MKPLALVIDDEESYRRLYADSLAAAGFETRTADSALAAREAMVSIAPSIIVSDVRMPGMDGISFLREVRESSPDLPFLLITAFADVRDAVKALKLGAVDYLEKPVDLDELLAKIAGALK